MPVIFQKFEHPPLTSIGNFQMYICKENSFIVINYMYRSISSLLDLKGVVGI